jgi:formylglycine-generating enzyme required for sulfatase activity
MSFTFVNSIGMKFRYIHCHSALVGCPVHEHKRLTTDLNRKLAKDLSPFWIAETVITQGQYYTVTNLSPSYFSNKQTHSKDFEYPVDSVSWKDSNRFCDLLSDLPVEKSLFRKYRLPSEIEWEAAARANTTSAFCYGSDISTDLANFDGSFPYIDGPPGQYLGRTSKVRSYPPNAFGLFDVHGSVWEWCSDNFTLDEGSDLMTTCRVLKGGSWHTYARFCRSSCRDAGDPEIGFFDQGFRIVCEISHLSNPY